MKLLKFFATFLFILSLIQVPFATAQTPTPNPQCLEQLQQPPCVFSEDNPDVEENPDNPFADDICYYGDKINPNQPSGFNLNCGYVPACGREKTTASCPNREQITPPPSSSCTISTTPTNLTTDTTPIGITIQTSGLSETSDYNVSLNGQVIRNFGPNSNTTYKIQNNQIIIPTVDSQGFTGGKDPEKFNAETYRIGLTEIANGTSKEVCVQNFTVTEFSEPIGGGDRCSIAFNNSVFLNTSDIQPYITNPQGQNLQEHRRLILKDRISGRELINKCEPRANFQKENIPSAGIGKLAPGQYSLEYTTTCKYILIPPGGRFPDRELTDCRVLFNVGGPGSVATPGVVEGADAVVELTSPPCGKNGFVNGKCTKVDTAIGTFDVEIAGFIRSIFSFILGIAGGIALLLIIYSGYQMLTSQGNPEAIQGAKETITSAIVGLLFIIFSFVILTIIGVDILKIPGFSQ